MSNSSPGDYSGAELIPPATQPNNPSAPAPTAGQVQQAQKQYGLHRYTDGHTIFGDMLQNLFGSDPNSVDTLDPATVQNLRNGLSSRTAPHPPATNYAAMSHQQLYDAVTQNTNAGQLGSTAATWDQSSQDLIESSQNTASQALAVSEQSWQGEAGNAARSAVAGLSNQMGQAGQAAQVSAQLSQQQSDALSTAAHTIPEPPAHPFNVAAAQQQLMTTTNPIAFAALANQDHSQLAAQQAAHQQAVTVVSNYDRVVTQTSQNQPGYAPASPVVAPGQGPTGSGVSLPHGSGGASGSAAPRLSNTRSATVGSAANAHAGASGGSATPPATNPAGGIGSPVGSTGTGASNYTGTPLGTGQTTGAGPASGAPGYGQPPAGAGTGTGDLAMIPPMGGPLSGGGADIVRSSPGFGSGGAGGFGPTGPGALGGGSSGSANGGGSGARSGVGAGAEAAEQSAIEEGAAGSRGGSGMGAMPGGRGGRGGEDGEHKRPDYLQEPDVEGFFGTDQQVAPRVIGE